MNLYEIAEKYPKAHKQLRHTPHRDIKEGPFPIEISNNILYEFFDSQNIIIEITSNSPSEYNPPYFFMNVKTIQGIAGGVYYNTRSEAEQAAFKKAFEILNNKL